MKKGSFIFFAIVCNGFVMNAQVDSLAMNKSDDTTMEEMVITTEIEPQSLKKAINNVRIISKEDIKNLGAVNLADALNQYINITVTPESSSGRSTVSMFGLGGSYFKILIDNIPLINDGGFGNNTDITQISLADVERIEIIEGSMGVTHGANAVSGILNVITKKSSEHKLEVSLTAQEETAGKEFSFFNKGRHIQNLKIGHSLNDKWYIGIGANRNDYRGFLGGKHNEFYDINDGTRGYRLPPKEQLQGNAVINYTSKNVRLFYRFEFLNEQVNYYESSVQSGFNDVFGAYKYANDERYLVNRLYHHLNATGKLFKQVNFNISLSQQLQERNHETFRYNITHDLESNNIKQKDQEMNVLYSTGTFNNFFTSKLFNLQFGYELLHNRGAAKVRAADSQDMTVYKNLDNYDFFVSSDINLNQNLSLRPGFRYSFQSVFEDQYAYSLGGRYLLNYGFEARAAFGGSFRTPTFEELYYKEIFNGHHFEGNPDLLPEKSTSFEASLKKVTYFKNNNATLSNHVMVSLSDIKDRISSVLIGYDGATPMYKNINVDKYKSLNLSSMNQFQVGNWDFGLGLSFIWRSEQIDSGTAKTSDEYLFSYNLNSKIAYKVPEWNTVFSAYYKFTGKTKEWDTNSTPFTIATVDSYGFLEASARKVFFNNKLEATLGVRNILDVIEVNRSRIVNTTGGHEVPTQLIMSNGRSYFIKLTYNFNLN